jgi:hypothetical protein
MRTFTGNSQDAQDVPILGADFFRKGVKIEGEVTRQFPTANGICYEMRLKTPVTVKGKKAERVAVGALKGFIMALQVAGVPDEKLLRDDKVIIECTGETPTDKGNPMLNFKVAVARP